MILMIILEVVLTPLCSRVHIPHFINVQRAVVGVATAHLRPEQLAGAFGGSGPHDLIPESKTFAAIAIVAWIAIWTILGAWRMATRDA